MNYNKKLFMKLHYTILSSSIGSVIQSKSKKIATTIANLLKQKKSREASKMTLMLIKKETNKLLPLAIRDSKLVSLAKTIQEKVNQKQQEGDQYEICKLSIIAIISWLISYAFFYFAIKFVFLILMPRVNDSFLFRLLYFLRAELATAMSYAIAVDYQVLCVPIVLGLLYNMKTSHTKLKQIVVAIDTIIKTIIAKLIKNKIVDPDTGKELLLFIHLLTRGFLQHKIFG